VRRIHLFRALVLAVILSFAGIAGGCRSEQDLVLDLSEAETVRVPPVAGVNTNFFFAPEELGNEAVWEAVEAADISVMRFPGGRGNRYDWETGALGASESGRTGGNVVPMDDFMSRARDEGISVSYVLDITDSPGSIRDLARHWEQTDAPVRWVEMGNEYYLRKLIYDIGGPQGYFEKARVALNALRAGGYDGPVGLVAAPPDKRTSREAVDTWNEDLAKEDTSDFDAVILHHYVSMEKTSLETVYDEAPSGLATNIERLRELFPEKQVWVTEWNLGSSPNDPEFNALGHALFDMRMLKAMLDNRIDLATYHTLTGLGWELLGPDRFALDYDDERVQLLRRVPYFAFEMAREAMSGGAAYLSGAEPAEGFGYMAFRTQDELRVVVWTVERRTTKINVKMDGSSPGFTEGETLRGNLDDTNGSLLRMDRSGGETWEEEVKPVPIGAPRLEGPGAVLLRFSL
jgi:hypothetical protein